MNAPLLKTIYLFHIWRPHTWTTTHCKQEHIEPAEAAAANNLEWICARLETVLTAYGHTYMRCTTAPHPLRASLSTALRRAWEIVSNKSSGSCARLCMFVHVVRVYVIQHIVSLCWLVAHGRSFAHMRTESVSTIYGVQLKMKAWEQGGTLYSVHTQTPFPKFCSCVTEPGSRASSLVPRPTHEMRKWAW